MDHHWVRLKLRHNYITRVNLSKIKEMKVVSNSEICLHNVFLRCFKNTEARRRVASSTATVIKFSWRSVGNSCSWISLLDPKGRILLFWGTKTAQLPGRPFFLYHMMHISVRNFFDSSLFLFNRPHTANEQHNLFGILGIEVIVFKSKRTWAWLHPLHDHAPALICTQIITST